MNTHIATIKRVNYLLSVFWDKKIQLFDRRVYNRLNLNSSHDCLKLWIWKPNFCHIPSYIYLYNPYFFYHGSCMLFYIIAGALKECGYVTVSHIYMFTDYLVSNMVFTECSEQKYYICEHLGMLDLTLYISIYIICYRSLSFLVKHLSFKSIVYT